jgi:phage antirepressor YoqD-like protein
MAVEKSAAVLTIKDAAAMTKRGAGDIAKWLRRQADMIEKSDERAVLADRYRARYIYLEGK